LEAGGTIRVTEVVLGMTGRRRTPAPESGRRDEIAPVPNLATSADVSRGRSNLASVPRAGNISTDSRAGRSGVVRGAA